MSVNPTRRSFLARSSAVVALTLSGCSINSHRQSALIMPNRHALPESASARELVRFATLAASGHNTQPWKFRVGPKEIVILPDFERRTPVVDPDDHHLYASLGCAVENLSTAALARGHAGEAVILPEAENGISVSLATTRAQISPLFDAIPERQVSRTEFNGQPIDSTLLQRLELAGSQYGVQAILITEKPAMEDVLGLIIEGNSRQLDDPAFVAELTRWIRFNPRAAERSGDGLFSAASGNPSLPSWLGPTVLKFVLTKDKENDKTTRQIRSSAGLVVFVADRNDPTGWINAGRAYERFALQATVEGIRHAFVNQAVEVPKMRERLQSLLGLMDARPNLIVRFGYGPTMPESYRRSVDSVIL